MWFAATWMELEMIIPTEVKSERGRQIPYGITYICDLKYDTNEHNCKTNINSQIQRTDLWLPRGGTGEKDWEFGINRSKLLYTGRINNNVLLYSTENYIQNLVANHNGKEYEKEYIQYLYITESLCCLVEANTTL